MSQIWIFRISSLSKRLQFWKTSTCSLRNFGTKGYERQEYRETATRTNNNNKHSKKPTGLPRLAVNTDNYTKGTRNKSLLEKMSDILEEAEKESNVGAQPENKAEMETEMKEVNGILWTKDITLSTTISFSLDILNSSRIFFELNFIFSLVTVFSILFS